MGSNNNEILRVWFGTFPSHPRLSEASEATPIPQPNHFRNRHHLDKATDPSPVPPWHSLSLCTSRPTHNLRATWPWKANMHTQPSYLHDSATRKLKLWAWMDLLWNDKKIISPTKSKKCRKSSLWVDVLTHEFDQRRYVRPCGVLPRKIWEGNDLESASKRTNLKCQFRQFLPDVFRSTHTSS